MHPSGVGVQAQGGGQTHAGNGPALVGPSGPRPPLGGAIVSHPTLALGWVHWGPRCVCALGGPGTLAPPRMQPLLLWPLACCLCAHPCTNMPVWEAWLCCNRKSDLCPLALASCSQIPSKVASLSVAAPRRPPHHSPPLITALSMLNSPTLPTMNPAVDGARRRRWRRTAHG